jgi:hypothetical protein
MGTVDAEAMDGDGTMAECQVCRTLHDLENGEFSEFTSTYPGGIDRNIIVGIGPHGRVIAIASKHLEDSSDLVIDWDLRQAAIRWLDDHGIAQDPRIRPFISFGKLEYHSESNIHDSNFYPPLAGVSPSLPAANDRNFKLTSPEDSPHPHVFVNVFILRFHTELPIPLVDEYARVAQVYAGALIGKKVRVSQMGRTFIDDDGYKRDNTVEIVGDWEEPFVIEDDCLFCRTMTEESIERRVAGFQWQMDREANNALSQQGDESPEGRRKVAELFKDAKSLIPAPLIYLPFHLKYKMCIEWNHVVRDWMQEDPRYSYAKGRYFVVWTERLGGPCMKQTRSYPYSSASLTGYSGFLWS